MFALAAFSLCAMVFGGDEACVTAGSFLLPYSWALHVAAWIQKNNGK